MEKHLGCCPSCGSGDMHFCNISVRPYCRECNWWAPVNFGTKEDALRILKERQRRAEVDTTNMIDEPAVLFSAVISSFEDEFGVKWDQAINIFKDDNDRWILKPYYKSESGTVRDECLGGYPSDVLIDNLFSDIRE